MSKKLIAIDLNIDTEAAALPGVHAGAIDQTLRIAIGGAPISEPVTAHGLFVMNTTDEICRRSPTIKPAISAAPSPESHQSIATM